MIIVFGQQPCGFFPKRFLVAKILTARRMQRELGGEIVFFYHDGDHDARETKTTLRHRQSGKPLDYNFEFENKIQRKFSPLYLKRVPAQWHRRMTGALPNYVPAELVEIFQGAPVTNVADFCLHIYQQMPGPDGRPLLEGIRVARSSDPALRTAACEITDYFADVAYQNEIVRARMMPGEGKTGRFLRLHEGGPVFIDLPWPAEGPGGGIDKAQITPTRDTRLKWMQSVLHGTHYIAGGGEQGYLNKADAPELTFVEREAMERMEEAYTEVA